MHARDRGLSLLEVLVAMALTMIAAGGLLVMATAHLGTSSVSPDAIDVVQRARAAMHAVARHLSEAGAGVVVDPRAGPLVRYFAPVLPRLMPLDAASRVRSDAITVVFVPHSRAQTTIASPLLPGEGMTTLSAGTNCPIGVPACGFGADTSAVVFDDEGGFDVMAVLDAQPGQLSLRRGLGEPGPTFQPGASIAEAQVHAYYVDRDRRQLRHHDGDRTDTPVIDQVVSAAFEYFGDVSPPRDPRPPAESANCLYDVGGVLRPELRLLAPPPFTLAALPLDLFADGPWCGAGATRYDADLLRVRLVRVTLHLQAGRVAARQRVPDYRISFDVAPRNLAVDR